MFSRSNALDRVEQESWEANGRENDYGKGIDPELLRQFARSGSGAGIGLTGMSERLRELGGRLEVESDANGTVTAP